MFSAQLAQALALTTPECFRFNICGIFVHCGNITLLMGFQLDQV
jgi:hypothetical protein